MKKNIQYKFGASLFALAFSLVGADEAWAQTCVPPPSCNTLGFTKTAADCAGKTILKCPFDTTKVYCPGAEEQGDTPYEVGDLYPKTGVSIGAIVAIQDGNYVVASIPQYIDNSANGKEYCNSYSGGGYSWYMPSLGEAIAIYQVFKKSIGSENCIKIIPDGIYNCAKNGKEMVSIYKAYNSCVIYVRM